MIGFHWGSYLIKDPDLKFYGISFWRRGYQFHKYALGIFIDTKVKNDN